MLFRPWLQLREFGIECYLFLQSLGIDIVSGDLLLERARQHHGSDNRDEQQHTRNLKRQRSVTIKTAADTPGIVRDAAGARRPGRKRSISSGLLCAGDI